MIENSLQYSLGKYFHHDTTYLREIRNLLMEIRDELRDVRKLKQRPQKVVVTTEVSENDFKNLWKQYPKRVGKKAALRHFQATIKTKQDLENIKQALNNYITSERVFKGYIQNGSTWFNNWRDWIEFEEKLCPKCKGKGVYVSSSGYEINCKCKSE